MFSPRLLFSFLTLSFGPSLIRYPLTDKQPHRTISNLNQGHTYTINISSGPTLARVNADWVVERPYYGSSLAAFPSFTDVWFDEAWATLNSGSLGILGAKQYQIPGLCASQEWDNSHEVSWSL